MNIQHLQVPAKKISRPGCMTRQQITAEYEWRSVQTFRTKLEQNGIELPSGSISPKWQKTIYDKLGYPPGVSKKDFEDV